MSLSPVPALPPPPHLDDPDEDDDGSIGGKMSFLEHLDELRQRLIRALLSVIGGFIIAAFFINYIFAFIMNPLQAVLPHGGKLIFTEPAEGFLLQMKMAALAGLMLALPVLLWQLWAFIAPGLYAHEKRFAIPFVAMSTTFFIAGAMFSHYVVFPAAWAFFASFATDTVEFAPRIGPTFSLYVRMALGLGAVFEMPTLVMFLARVGLVTPRYMIRNTKYAVLIIFVVAAIVTPGSDPVSLFLVAVPMIGLYAFSIVVAWIFKKRRTPEPASADDVA
ncbi:MAG: twin-arginine translocase subunit TatC [Acidobacteria bacterium]|nr:twin-arginine translocase subunit TatC [Acidobacteriota bacterium]